MTSLKKNLVYQSIYQLLNIAFPLFTAPYLARCLGAESLGIMSYTTSVVNYFTLFAMMGLINYGTRSIAAVKNDKKECSILFSQIFGLQIITCILSLSLYIGYMLFFCNDNRHIAWIQMIYVISCFFDISWLLFGMEAFEITIKRGIVIRISSLFLMFKLVKNPNDLWIYALLLAVTQFLNQFVLWFQLSSLVEIHKPRLKDIYKHFLPNIYLFIPLLAMSVYHIMDKTMLGLFSDYLQSGYYYNADKVVNIPVGILIGIGTVMLPRMTALKNEGKISECNELFKTSIRLVACISAAMACGIAAISAEFTPLFFGPGYESCVWLITFLAPVLFIKSLSLVARNLYLIPNNMERYFTISIICGAITNLFFNIILIPKYGALGAVLGTLFAEFVACVLQYGFIYKYIDFRKELFSGAGYLIIGTIMFLLLRFIAVSLDFLLIYKIIIEIIAGVIIYAVFCISYWKFFNVKQERDIILAFFRK